MRKTLAAALLFCAALPPHNLRAEPRTYESEYAISVLGLPVGTSRFRTTVGPDRYEMTGTLTARGLLAVFQPTSGSVSAVGRIAANDIEARNFTLNYVSGDDTQLTEIGFAQTATSPRRSTSRR
jgi:hypothetical protein